MTMGRVTVFRTYTAQASSNTAFINQTLLCKAPYCLALLYYIHAQHDKSLPFTYNPASVVQRAGWSSLCRPCSHHFRHPILNYVICRRNRGNKVSILWVRGYYGSIFQNAAKLYITASCLTYVYSEVLRSSEALLINAHAHNVTFDPWRFPLLTTLCSTFSGFLCWGFSEK